MQLVEEHAWQEDAPSASRAAHLDDGGVILGMQIRDLSLCQGARARGDGAQFRNNCPHRIAQEKRRHGNRAHNEVARGSKEGVYEGRDERGVEAVDRRQTG